MARGPLATGARTLGPGALAGPEGRVADEEAWLGVLESHLGRYTYYVDTSNLLDTQIFSYIFY